MNSFVEINTLFINFILYPLYILLLHYIQYLCRYSPIYFNYYLYMETDTFNAYKVIIELFILITLIFSKYLVNTFSHAFNE